MSYRELDFSVEIPEDEDDTVATAVTSMGQHFVAVAADLTEQLIEGRYRFALTPAGARCLHAALSTALSVSAADETSDSSNSASEQIASGSSGDIREPRSVQTAGGLDERFASLVSQMLGDLDGDTRRFEREMTKRDQVYILAFEQVQAAMKQVAEVVRPLFGLPGFEVEDLKAILNGTVQSVYLTWSQAHPEGRRSHDH